MLRYNHVRLHACLSKHNAKNLTAIDSMYENLSCILYIIVLYIISCKEVHLKLSQLHDYGHNAAILFHIL